MMKQKKYFPQLDAIRGLSFLCVFFFHAYKPILGNSVIEKILAYVYSNLTLSIDVFFVLSSFLLTFLGISEYQKYGKFSFKNYFIRRALRIWPLYYLLMFFSFVILKKIALYSGLQLTLPPSGWYLFFIANYYSIGHVFFLQVLWTLSVEEQFYLVWGICLTLFQKKLKTVILLFILVSVIFNLWGGIQNLSIYFHTLTYLFDMMAGAYAALCVYNKSNIVKVLQRLSGLKSVLFYLILIPFFIGCYFISGSLNEILNNIFSVMMRFAFIIYCCLVIIDQMVNEQRIFDFAKNRIIVYTGKISYGLYCFHGFVISICGIVIQKYKIEIPSVFLLFILLIITFIVASLSYYIIEKPFLKLKGKLARV